ncbi:hypothetical protein [Paraprevotella clara]|uniref:hypothetical protein n=1 Tax=Paraprevotella clara TaxID=454154 RepID=UPI0026745B95|nr:hypothetical protein [Paraprevotella clara]
MMVSFLCITKFQINCKNTQGCLLQFLKSTHLHFTPSSSNLCIISWFFIVSPQSAGLPLFIQPITIALFIIYNTFKLSE